MLFFLEKSNNNTNESIIFKENDILLSLDVRYNDKYISLVNIDFNSFVTIDSLNVILNKNINQLKN